jgi:copper homeostasis protein
VPVLIEAAVESLAAALAATEGGAHRLELCTDLAHGGTTPDLHLLRKSLSLVPIPIFLLVRPRPGDFVYSAAEHRAMIEQIHQAKQAGAHGIVTGALSADREIAETETAALIAAARPLPVTFHRAFDACRDQAQALELLIRLGVERVLTSGGAETAAEGIEQLGRLVKQARDRMVILAGGGINPENARTICDTGVREVHFSVKEAQKVRRVIEALA